MASGPVCGGLEKHFVDLCNGLADKHDVMAIAHPAHGKALSANVQFYPMDMKSSRRNPLNLLRLHRKLQKFEPDVIHAHANKAAAMIGALSRLTSARTVATIHGFKSSNRVFSKHDAVIAVSEAIKEQLSIPQACVIPNGIDPFAPPPRDPDYFTRTLGFAKHRPVALSVGRLAPVKGFEGLIRAWQSIDADLLIAGEGPDRGMLQSLSENLGVCKSVHMLGYRNDISLLMANSDLVVIPSEREGFPYVLVEALHLEKVIVATQFPGAKSLLPNSYVVPYGNAVALRGAIVQVMANPAKAACEFTSTWRLARSSFTIQRMVEQTTDVYRGLFRAVA